MAARKDEAQVMIAKRKVGVSGRANGQNGGYSATGLLSWYLAQRPLNGLEYLLTINGYVLV